MGIGVVTLQGMNAAYSVHHSGDNIFTDIRLPELIDRETLINRITLRCGEFSVMHTDYEWMHEQILNFFLIHYETFSKWAEVLNAEYNPLENYDRQENWRDWGDSKNKAEGEDKTTLGSSSTTTKAAFNSSSYEPYEKNTNSGTDKMERKNSGEDNFRTAHEGRVYGNIGVTTSQQMLQSELDLRRFNIYMEIANLFADEFCIQVY